MSEGYEFFVMVWKVVLNSGVNLGGKGYAYIDFNAQLLVVNISSILSSGNGPR